MLGLLVIYVLSVVVLRRIMLLDDLICRGGDVFGMVIVLTPIMNTVLVLYSLVEWLCSRFVRVFWGK